MHAFTHQLKVYYEDTDAQGVVYYANYFKYLERARTEWLNHNGLSVSKLTEEQDILFVVKRVELDYNSPARLEDVLSVSCEPISMKFSSIVLKQEVRRGEQVLAHGQVVLIAVDQKNFRPTRLPDKLLES